MTISTQSLQEYQKRIFDLWKIKKKEMCQNNPDNQPVRDEYNYPTLKMLELVNLLLEYEDMPVYLDNSEYGCLVGLTKKQIKLEEDKYGKYLIFSENEEMLK